MHHGLVRALDWPVMDLGREPKRDTVGSVVGGGHAEIAAGGLVVLAVGAVLPVQEQGDLINRLIDADECLLAVIEEKGRGLDLVRWRRVESRLELGGEFAGDPADSEGR